MSAQIAINKHETSTNFIQNKQVIATNSNSGTLTTVVESFWNRIPGTAQSGC